MTGKSASSSCHTGEAGKARLPVRIERRERHVRQKFWTKLKRVFARIPFAADLVAAYYCAMDPATPARVRGVLLAALAYFILPADAIPDFIAGLGFSDDAAVLTIAMSLLSGHIKPAHHTAAAKALAQHLPPESPPQPKA